MSTDLTAEVTDDLENDDPRGWIGVDFDQTLAVHHPGHEAEETGEDGEILNQPIWYTVNRMLGWIAEGRDVRIYTARCASTKKFHKDGSPKLDDDVVSRIQDWCEEHVQKGWRPPVQFWKDSKVDFIVDDKAEQVFPNTGIPVEDYVWR